MNREGAETFLRLLAEAELRGPLAAAARPPGAGGLGAGWQPGQDMAVAQALTAVGALDAGTVEDILADFDLAVSVRRLHEQASPGPAGSRNRATRSTATPVRCGPRRRPAWPPRSVRPLRTAARAGRLARSRPAGSTGSPEAQAGPGAGAR